MFVQNLISDFNNQLSISDHDLNVLSGFFHFLKNQTNTSRASVPYGLLLQYDNEKVKELFLDSGQSTHGSTIFRKIPFGMD